MSGGPETVEIDISQASELLPVLKDRLEAGDREAAIVVAKMIQAWGGHEAQTALWEGLRSLEPLVVQVERKPGRPSQPRDRSRRSAQAGTRRARAPAPDDPS